MFRYKPVDMSRQSFYSSTHTLEAPTLEALEALCRAKEVDRVIIPHTFDFEGYGADLVSLSNSRSIKRDYKDRVKAYGHELSISAWQFLKHGEFRDMIENLQENYPVYDEDDYSKLEDERHEQFLVDVIGYAINDDDDFPDSWNDENIRAVLHSGSMDLNADGETWTDTRLDWWELVSTDNDGLTPYMKDEEFEAFLIVFKARAVELGKLKK